MENKDKRTKRGIREGLKADVYSYFDSMEDAFEYADIDTKK